MVHSKFWAILSNIYSDGCNLIPKIGRKLHLIRVIVRDGVYETVQKNPYIV